MTSVRERLARLATARLRVRLPAVPLGGVLDWTVNTVVVLGVVSMLMTNLAWTGIWWLDGLRGFQAMAVMFACFALGMRVGFARQQRQVAPLLELYRKSLAWKAGLN